MIDQAWQWSDAWILTSVMMCGRSAKLSSIISIGDMLNHAIFTYDEICIGIDRLQRAGLLTPVEGGWMASQDAKTMMKAAERGKPGMFETIAALHDQMKTVPAPPESDINTVTREQFQTAVAEYQASWRRFPAGCLAGILMTLASSLCRMVQF